MAITVRFFAGLRERAGADAITLDIEGPVDAEGLMALLRRKLGDQLVAQLDAPEVRVALNKEFVDDPWSVVDGDEIAFMPPITGG